MACRVAPERFIKRVRGSSTTDTDKRPNQPKIFRKVTDFAELFAGVVQW